MAGASDPTIRYLLGDERSVGFLNTIVTDPVIEVGDPAHYHDFADPWASRRTSAPSFPSRTIACISAASVRSRLVRRSL